MEIKILAEARTKLQKLFVGWGVSFLVGDDLLFDTFSGGRMFLKKLYGLNVDIKQLKYIVISHEHWDHFGGLWDILKINPDVKVFICPNSSDAFKHKIREFNAEVIEAKNITKIKEGIFSTGEIMGEYAGKPMPEQSLVIKNNKISVITGCSHPGIIAIIEKVKEGFPYPVDMVLGGFHLLDKTGPEIDKIINEFKRLKIGRMAACHCTGKTVIKLLRREYKENFIEVKAGSTIKIEQ